ncbi:MAG: sigma-70 family RNA polymerase sigma factor [Tannerella sp.]|jgi:RNA polymerase sigma-70 factor (ECF subfamily)|nr:sigma-70 family RNA polymerase sigma factor [Tannerella sp.]
MKRNDDTHVKTVDIENKKTHESERKDLNKSTITFELIEALRDGNEKAYEQIYNYYYTPVIRFIYTMVKSTELAKDFYQEIFMNVWIRRKTIDPSKNFKFFIFVAARNVVFDYFRKYKESGWDEKEVMAIQDSNYADDKLLLKDTLKQIRKVVSKMPQQRKNIFILSRIDNISNHDISQQLHITKNAVEKHLCFALKDIRNTLFNDSKIKKCI